MEKYIFLDIDGVIATYETIDKGSWGLTPRCQNLLGEILEKTEAKIIITSSWREQTLEDTISYFKSKGFKFCDKIIGITIRAYHYIDKEKKVHLSIPRGVEIKQYLDTHIIYPWYAYPERDSKFRIYDDNGNFKKMRMQKLNKDYTYLILDDDSDMLLEHKDYFIQTDSMLGLQLEHVSKAINILNKYDN